jgi:hypothetical protein
MVEAGQREKGYQGYVSAALLDLWVDGIDLACIEAAGHQHRREDIVEAETVLDQREIRFEIRRERSRSLRSADSGPKISSMPATNAPLPCAIPL